MSRKNRRASKQTLSMVASPRDHAAVMNDGFSDVGYLVMAGGFQAGAQSPSRGYLYWPTTDTRRQLTSYTRDEIARRIQWLYAHFGFARRLVNGMARMLGYLTPQPSTSDDEWNALAFGAFMAIATSAEIWDRAAKFDFFQGQLQDNVSIFRDGDGLAVFTETETGRARMAYYEAHQLKNGPNTGSYWVDGCRLDDGGKHIGYSLRDGENPNISTTVDARDALYLGAFENRGAVRSLSVLAGAVLNMIDVVETRGFTKSAIKAHSRIGTVIEQDMGQVVMQPGGGFAGPIVQAARTMPDGSTQIVNMEMVLNGAQSPTLQPGQRIKVVADDRPTPNNMEFEKSLLRDCAYYADLSYERLCDMSGITGPGLRMLNADDKRWIKLKHYTQAKRCHRQYVYTIAKELKAGRLRMPNIKPGEYWWNKCQWIGLANPDIDGGRTASATLTDLQSGQTHWLEEWGKKGFYWKNAIDQSIDEVIYATLRCIARSREAGLPDGLITPEKVFPQRFSISNAQPPLEPPQPGKANFAADTSDPADDPEGTD